MQVGLQKSILKSATMGGEIRRGEMRMELLTLCDAKGKLNMQTVGYSPIPKIDANVKRRLFRRKNWNHWIVYGEEAVLTFLIADFSHTVVGIVTFFDLETDRFLMEKVDLTFNRQMTLGTHPSHSSHFIHDDLTIECVREEAVTHLLARVSSFDGEPFQTNLKIEHPTQDESLNVVIPTTVDEYQMTSKQFTLPTSGTVTLGNREYHFHPEYSFSVANMMRGIWGRKVEWCWGVASQRVGDERIGLNLSNGWTDGKGYTDNGVVIDGKLHIINEELQFLFNPQNMSEKWGIKTKYSSRVQLTFTPFFEEQDILRMKLSKLKVQRVKGYFDGIIELNTGAPLRIRQLLGTIEYAAGKW